MINFSKECLPNVPPWGVPWVSPGVSPGVPPRGSPGNTPGPPRRSPGGFPGVPRGAGSPGAQTKRSPEAHPGVPARGVSQEVPGGDLGGGTEDRSQGAQGLKQKIHRHIFRSCLKYSQDGPFKKATHRHISAADRRGRGDKCLRASASAGSLGLSRAVPCRSAPRRSPGGSPRSAAEMCGIPKRTILKIFATMQKSHVRSTRNQQKRNLPALSTHF